jgi:hypothetical protein
MNNVPAVKVATTLEASEIPLPPQIQEALGELVGAARDCLLALSVGVGLGVVHELMKLELDEVVGPKGKHTGRFPWPPSGYGNQELHHLTPAPRPLLWDTLKSQS